MTSKSTAWPAVLFSLGCSKGAPDASASPPPNVATAAVTRTPSAPVVVATRDAGAPRTEVATLVGKTLSLPGASGAASLDYLFYDSFEGRLWVPGGATGSVDVLEAGAAAFTRIPGFGTVEREAHGKKRTVGPSSASGGDGFVYVGNRATSEVCAVDSKTLRSVGCTKLSSPPDGVSYVSRAKELWVTVPSERALDVFDVSTRGAPKPKLAIKVDGQPEGYGVDETRGFFFTNLEDKGTTVELDVATHAVKATWNPGCGPDGPRGLAVDAARDFVVVACTDRVRVLDAGHGGALLGELDAGSGVDNVDYLAPKELLYVAAGKAARLTVASLNDKGALTVVATGATTEGSRNAVADKDGDAYVADSQNARIWIFPAPKPR